MRVLAQKKSHVRPRPTRQKLPSKTTVTLKPPHLLVHNKDELEVSIHVAPRAVLRELQQVFGGKITFDDAVVAIPTTQHTAMQMVNWGDDAAIEKDRCLEAFFAFAEAVRKKTGAALVRFY